MTIISQVWCYMPIYLYVQHLGSRARWVDLCEFLASLVYVVDPVTKKKVILKGW